MNNDNDNPETNSDAFLENDDPILNTIRSRNLYNQRANLTSSIGWRRRHAIYRPYGPSNFLSRDESFRGGENEQNLQNSNKGKSERVQITLKEIMKARMRKKEEESEDRIDGSTGVKLILRLWARLQVEGFYQTFSDLVYVSNCSFTEFFGKLCSYLTVLFCNNGKTLFNVRRARDKERKLLNFLIPYTIPLVSYSKIKRLMCYDFYVPHCVILFRLLENQLTSRVLVFRKINTLLYLVLFCYFPFRHLGFADISGFLVEILPCVRPSLNPFNCVGEILTLVLSKMLLDPLKFVPLALKSFPNRSSEYVFLSMIIYCHSYIQSLDVFKLESEFLERHVHVVFSPSTFLCYSYIYLILMLLIPYSIVFFVFRCYYIPILLPVMVSIVITLSHYLKSALSHILYVVLICIMLNYHEKLDCIANTQFFARTTEINMVLLCYRVSMSLFRIRFRLTSLIRLLVLIFVTHINSVYRISKYNNR